MMIDMGPPTLEELKVKMEEAKTSYVVWKEAHSKALHSWRYSFSSPKLSSKNYEQATARAQTQQNAALARLLFTEKQVSFFRDETDRLVDWYKRSCESAGVYVDPLDTEDSESPSGSAKFPARRSNPKDEDDEDDNGFN